jgi:hypothetical protein
MAIGIVDRRTFCLEQIRLHDAERHVTLKNIRRGLVGYRDLERTQIAFYQGDIYRVKDAVADDPDDVRCVRSNCNGDQWWVTYDDPDLYLEPNAWVVESWFRRHSEDNTR